MLYSLLYSLLCFCVCRGLDDDPVMSCSNYSTEQQSCTQIIPYNPPEIIKPFHEKSRTFSLCGKEWNLIQDWNQQGVAGVVWEAAIVLGGFLENNQLMVKDKTVIELGSGTGLVGMITAALGASRVDITDRNIQIAQANVLRNVGDDSDIVSVVKYEWGQPVLPPLLPPPYDVVIGSDVIYIEETYPQLMDSLKLLCGKDTLVLLASKLRYSRVENFLDLIKESFEFHLVYKKDNIFIYLIKMR